MNKFVTCFGCLLSLAALGLIGILAMAFFGQANRHPGRIELGLINSQADRFVYEGKLRSDSSIFRPNSLFVVEYPVALFEPGIAASSLDWIPEDPKGLVRIEAPVAVVNSLKAEFSLRIRWTRLAPAIAVVLTLALSFFHWRWHVRTQVSNSIEVSNGSTVGRKNLRIANISLGPSKAYFIVSHSILLSMITYYFLNILWPIGWMYGDSHYFLSTIAKGEFTTGAYFEEVGRFFPLAFVDLNLLLPFGNNPLASQIERFVLFSVLIGILYQFMAGRCAAWVASLLLTIYLTTSELLHIFCDVIFPETLLSIALVVFFSSYYRAQQSQQVVHGLIAASSAGLATYCKEPVFGALVVFAISQLFFGYRQLSRTSIAINGFLLLNGIVFIALYYYFCGQGKNYVDVQLGGDSMSPIRVMIQFLAKPLITAMLCFAGYRLTQVVFQKDHRYIFEDGILLTGTSYVFAFAWLRLSADYYLIPAYTCWFCALPGYFATSRQLNSFPVDETGNSGTSTLSRLPHSQEKSLQLGLFGLIIIACLGVSNVIKGGEMVRDARTESGLANRTIGDLVNLGYEIFIYLPSDMTPRDQLVQSWRQLVINTFYNSSLDGSSKNESNPDPCSALSQLELDNLSAARKKCLIIYDPKYDLHGLNQSTGSTAADFCRVFEFPLLLGAQALAPRECIEEIKIALRRD